MPPNAVTACLIALLAIMTMACQGKPIPMTAVRGTSVLIPVGAGTTFNNEGLQMGFGTPTLLDWQRGRLHITLDSESGFPLPVRGVSRVRADRASPAGLSEANPLVNPFWLGDQVVALVDVPGNAPLGLHDVYVTRYIRHWDGTDWDQEIAAAPAPSYNGTLEIVAGAGSPTPFEAFIFDWTDVSGAIPGFVPYPKFRFVVQSGSTPIGSAHFTVTYPASRISIRGVVAEPIDTDSIDWGPSAFISYSDTPGVLQVSCVAPEGVIQPAFAIVFDLIHPSAPPASGGGPAVNADFVFSNVQAWDVSGAALTPTVPNGQKKIF
jgi:hypothetical protein